MRLISVYTSNKPLSTNSIIQWKVIDEWGRSICQMYRTSNGKGHVAICTREPTWMGVTMSIFVPSVLGCFSNTGYILDIMFIFHRCHRSSAAVTLVKYECDSNGITPTFAKIRYIPNGEINERIFSDPHPWTAWQTELINRLHNGDDYTGWIRTQNHIRICAWFCYILCTCGCVITSCASCGSFAHVSQWYFIGIGATVWTRRRWVKLATFKP